MSDGGATRLMFVGAHPDDVEFACAGTIAKSSSLGCQVSIATWSPRREGSDENQPGATRRLVEAERAAELLGAKLVHLTSDGWPSLAAAIRQDRPQILVYGHAEDAHPFHAQVAEWCSQAVYYAQLPSTNIAGEAWRVLQQLQYRAYSSVRFNPDVLVDVTSSFSTAKRALAQHETGVAMLPVLPHTMLVQHMYDGVMAGVPYAEAFALVRSGWDNHVACRQALYSWLLALTERPSDTAS